MLHMKTDAPSLLRRTMRGSLDNAPCINIRAGPLQPGSSFIMVFRDHPLPSILISLDLGCTYKSMTRHLPDITQALRLPGILLFLIGPSIVSTDIISLIPFRTFLYTPTRYIPSAPPASLPPLLFLTL